MKKLILLQGASGTGKSSWVREHLVQNCTISADDIRQYLGLTVHTRRGNMPIIKINFRKDMNKHPDKYNWLEWLDAHSLTENDIKQLIDN